MTICREEASLETVEKIIKPILPGEPEKVQRLKLKRQWIFIGGSGLISRSAKTRAASHDAGLARLLRCAQVTRFL